MLEILYRDALILTINKPHGLPVHKGAGRNIPTLEDFLDDLRFGLPKRPELAHRLDKDTTGCLILGRNKEGLKRLHHIFSNHHAKKIYFAIAEREIPEATGTITFPIAKKSNAKHSWWGKVDEKGQPAETLFTVLAKNTQASFVQLQPLTGRTHQLRIHMQAIGHPILGDTIYGQKNQPGSLCLHAYSIQIPLYPKKPPILITCSLPQHFLDTLAQYQLNVANLHL